MSEKRELRYMVVEKAGVVDLDGLYKMMQRWFYDNKYYFEEGLHRQRATLPSGEEYEWKWTGWRKVNEYIKFNISLFFHIWDAQDMEVIKNGQKIKLTKCRVRIEFNGNVEYDWKKTFEKTKFHLFLRKVYHKFLLKEERQMAWYWDELYYRVFKLQTIAKEYLDMEAKGNAYYEVW